MRGEALRAGTRGAILQKTAVAALFVALLVPAVLRGNVGNDYMRYVAFMHLANVRAYVPTEPGFNGLVRLVYGLCGYENYLLVFALFSFATLVCFFFAIRRQAEDAWFSFFLFLALGYYFQTYNTVRYYFALSLVLVALTFLLRRQPFVFAGLTLVAALFHKSALVALVLYPLCMVTWSLPAVIGLGALSAAAACFPGFWLKVIVFLYPSYEGTAFLIGARGSLVSVLRCAAVLLLAVLMWRLKKREGSVYALDGAASSDETAFRDRQLAVYLRMNALALWIYLWGTFVPELSRIGYYLTITQMFLIPMLLKRLPENRGLRKWATRLALAGACLYFAAFVVKASGPDVRIFPYRSFLFYDLPAAIIE